jgi:hypothetical protein
MNNNRQEQTKKREEEINRKACALQRREDLQKRESLVIGSESV